MVTIYGSPKSSSGRCFWCLEEAQVPYDAKSINFKEKQHKSEDFLKINPNGKVPVLTDGEFTVWESMAINHYLAETHKPELLGTTVQNKALVQQWTLWALAELQPPIIDVFIQLVFVPEDRRDLKAIEKATAKLPSLLETLNAALLNKTHLVGDAFSLADLHVFSVASLCRDIKFDTSSYKNMNAWMLKILERPAYKNYQKLCN